MKKIILPMLAALLIAMPLLTSSVSAAEPGSKDDPLISFGYVQDTYTREFTEKIRSRLDASLGTVYARLAEMSVSNVRSTANVNAVFIKTGGSFSLTGGHAALTISFGAVIDTSAGIELTPAFAAEGAEHAYGEVRGGRLYVVAEHSLAYVTAPDGCTLSLDGDFTVPDFVSASFTDVGASHWAYAPVESMAALSLVNGRGGGVFDPDSYMTRGDFVTVLGRLYGVDVLKYAGAAFADVASSDYFAPYVNWAASEGLVGGYGDGVFGADDKITRAQMAVLIMRFCDKMGISLNRALGGTFPDDGDIPDWAKQQVYTARGAGLIHGRDDGSFDPGGFTRRSEVCAVIYRLIAR